MNELALFNSLFSGNDTGFPFPDVYRVQTCGVPKVDVREDKDAYLLDMDLPGRTDKDIDINLKDGVLSVRLPRSKTANTEKKIAITAA